MKLMKVIALCVMTAIQSTAIASTTYNVGEFQHEDIRFGMTVDEVVEVLTSTYRISRDDLTFRLDKSPLRVTGEVNTIHSIRYTSDKIRITVDFIPDLKLIEGGNYLAVHRFYITHKQGPSLDERLVIAEEKYGPHSVKYAGNFYWCTQLDTSASGKAICDDSFASFELNRTGLSAASPEYADEYFGRNTE